MTGGQRRTKASNDGGGAKSSGGRAAGGLGRGVSGVDEGAEAVGEVDGVAVVGVEREERERVRERELVAAERLESAGAAEERAREARLGLEREGALLGDGLVVDWADLEKASGAVAVEDGAVGVAARGEAERDLVLAQRPRVVARLEEAVAFLFELVRTLQEDANVHRLVRRRRRLGRGGRRFGGGGGLLLFGPGLAHGDKLRGFAFGEGDPDERCSQVSIRRSLLRTPHPARSGASKP